jgi:hypothetical protein
MVTVDCHYNWQPTGDDIDYDDWHLNKTLLQLRLGFEHDADYSREANLRDDTFDDDSRIDSPSCLLRKKN